MESLCRDVACEGGTQWAEALSTLLNTKVEIAIAGLDGAGKSRLADALQPTSTPAKTAKPKQPRPPTIGLVVQTTRLEGTELKLWDLGGHRRFRDDWPRYAADCAAIVYVVDCVDHARLAEARQALHQLLDEPATRGLPLLVLANKMDLLPLQLRADMEAEGWQPLARSLNLDCVTEHPWCILGVSAAHGRNLAQLRRWLVLVAYRRWPERDDEGGAADDDSSWTRGVERLVSRLTRRHYHRQLVLSSEQGLTLLPTAAT